jgi:DNA polymerase III delta prime subunit
MYERRPKSYNNLGVTTSFMRDIRCLENDLAEHKTHFLKIVASDEIDDDIRAMLREFAEERNWIAKE